MWIVDSLWVRESVIAGVLLDPEKYEVRFNLDTLECLEYAFVHNMLPHYRYH